MEKVTEVGAGWGLLGMSVMLLLLAAGCRDAPPGAGDAPGEGMDASEASVTVFFSRGGEAVGVRRILEQTTGPRGSEQGPEGAPRSPEDVEAGLEAALKELLKGPTAEEQEEGLTSWFSAETTHSLLSVSVDGQGNAIVDFHDLSPLIPSASSSAGSAMLLQQLNATVFHRPDVGVVEYRMEGSCDAFWNWLQYDCQLVSRGSADPPPDLSWDPQESGRTP